MKLAALIIFGGIAPLLARGESPVNRPALNLCFRGEQETELAPHGGGNVYAPSVVIEDGVWRMWYGGQGRDGHDRIHYAESRDEGRTWTKLGVVLGNGTANHVNDPSVVHVGHTWFMLYTVAEQATDDAIALATSPDGRTWQKCGVVLGPGAPGTWDARIVGRPSVLHEDGVFKMWFDGTTRAGNRDVGLASSADGFKWTCHGGNPVFRNAGAVDVTHTANGYTLLFESPAGTRVATSREGLNWEASGLIATDSPIGLDRFGQVTPHAVRVGETWRVFVGAAGRQTWDGNAVAWFALDRLASPPSALGLK
jgi:hypothetical protein